MIHDTINSAGAGLSGKEDERMPEELAAKTRRAKLTRRSGQEDGQETGGSAEAAATVEQQADDVYYDALLRFGIQI